MAVVKGGNDLHEGEGVFTYSSIDLASRLANLDADKLPDPPDVFLDVSYCHLDRHLRKTWCEPGEDV